MFRHSLAREAASAIAGRVDRRAFVSRFAPVRLKDVPEQPLPAADWVRVRTTFSGLCGSDVKQILLNGSGTTRSPRWCRSRTCWGTRWSGGSSIPASASCSTRGCRACRAASTLCVRRAWPGGTRGAATSGPATCRFRSISETARRRPGRTPSGSRRTCRSCSRSRTACPTRRRCWPIPSACRCGRCCWRRPCPASRCWSTGRGRWRTR